MWLELGIDLLLIGCAVLILRRSTAPRG